MQLEDVPEIKGIQFPVRISVCISEEASRKLKELKKDKKKDTAELIRMLIDSFFNKLDQRAS